MLRVQRRLFAKIGQVEMKCNSENTSDANGVHLEGNFLFFSLFLLLYTKLFDRCGITFFYKWLKAALLFCFTCFPSFFLSLIILDFCFVKYFGEINCDIVLIIMARLHFFNSYKSVKI